LSPQPDRPGCGLGQSYRLIGARHRHNLAGFACFGSGLDP
jgi:hypothetical protein